MQDGITKRDFLRAGLAGLGALVLRGRSAEGARKQPNVLILTTDQQRVDVMSGAGNPWAETPHMDSIAARGVTFTNSYCPYPLCSPSRASLHTSRMPHELRVDHNSMAIDPAVPISGQVFRAAGYDTGYAGKWHLPNPYPDHGIAGYEVLNKTQRRGKLAHEVDESTMASAIDFLQRKRDKPFLLVASFINPHDICLLAGEAGPLLDRVRAKYRPPAGAELPPMPPNFPETAGAPARVAQHVRHPQWDETAWRTYRYAYYRMLEDVDRQVGQVLEALRQTGQEDDTVILFTSDHGEGLGSHQRTGKLMFYGEEAAVPLIVSWRGGIPVGRIDREHLVSALDVLPTICDYAGVQPPAVVRGQSLRPAIEKPDQPGRNFLVSEIALGGPGGPGRSFMVATRKYKYMAFPGPAGNAEMLLDLRADPGEMKNLASDPALARELESHRQLLAQWNQTTEITRYPVLPNPEAPRGRANGRPQRL